ncbi:hypothetical protein DPMN_076254 [Dreissena polymorpha]|uniref:Uncharacterized protein n=1 Tax=Dreissena polymorpha TaxID=45954 RepID=A0A9D3YJS1_DREPO|nr:hypothetical protein DPMN_076254 [Dreissena polymorpha]
MASPSENNVVATVLSGFYAAFGVSRFPQEMSHKPFGKDRNYGGPTAGGFQVYDEFTTSRQQVCSPQSLAR